MPLTRNGNHAVHYRTWGEPGSPALLMIMGLGLSCHAWDALPERLATRMRVIAFDHRGTGGSGPVSWSCSMAQLAAAGGLVTKLVILPTALMIEKIRDSLRIHLPMLGLGIDQHRPRICIANRIYRSNKGER